MTYRGFTCWQSFFGTWKAEGNGRVFDCQSQVGLITAIDSWFERHGEPNV